MVTILPSLYFSMSDLFYQGCFAGQRIFFSFRHPETPLYFHNYLEKALSIPDASDVIRIPLWEFEQWHLEWGMADDGNTEYGLTVSHVSDRLLKGGACVFHAAAFLYRGKAWLFAAESGIGKSTQLLNWTKLYSSEIKVMNGDKPILKLDEDGAVTVYPSPWRGKEEWGDDNIVAPLGGVILLKQGPENALRYADPLHHAARFLSCFFSNFEDDFTVKKLCEIEDAIWRNVPVWHLTNVGDPASARMLHDAISGEEQNDSSER